jgi:putative adhesin
MPVAGERLTHMEKLMMRTILAAGALALAIGGAGVTAAPVRADDWSKTYQVNGRADVHVSTDDGDVFVTGGDQKQIDVHVITQGYKIASSEVRIEESQNGNQVTVSVKLPHLNWSLWGGRHKSIRVEVHVPRDLDLEVQTSDGNVTAQDVSGRIQFSTGDGNVTASAIRGQIRLHTGDGHIEGTNFDGALEADTGDGNLRISGRFDSLELKTGDGNIDGQVGSGSKVANAWRIHSGDGHIDLRIPADLAADVDAKTGDGSITVNIPLTINGSLSHSSVHGKLNGGGQTLSISSGDGSIRLEKL